MLLLFTFGGGFILFLYYLMDQENFVRNMSNVYFITVNNYHYCCIKFEEIVDYYNNLTIENQPNNVIVTPAEPIHENQVMYSYEPYKTENTLSYYNYAPNANIIDKSKNPILFLKSYVEDDYKYLQFNDISLNLNFLLPLKPVSTDLFIQFELIYNGTTYDISLNTIKPFLINKNMIFNKKFVKWFMKSNFNIDIDSTYTIKIIDSSINMLELNDSQYISIEDNTYSIKNESS